MWEQKLSDQILVVRGLGRDATPPPGLPAVLFERADGRTEKAGNDLVRVVAEQHRRLQQLGAELDQELPRFHFAYELVGVGGAAHLGDHSRRLENTVAPVLPLDGELVGGKLDFAFPYPEIQ